MSAGLLSQILHTALGARTPLAAAGGLSTGAGATYLTLTRPRLRFVNIGDPPSRHNRHGQGYWIANPSGSPVPDYELSSPQYLVAHVAPMNDPSYDSSFRAIAPNGELLVGEVIYSQAMRAAQRHFRRRWLLDGMPRPGRCWPRPLWPHLRPSSAPSLPPEYTPLDDSDDIPF